MRQMASSRLTAPDTKLKPGQVVRVNSFGAMKGDVLIIRTYVDGDFRAVRLDTEVGAKLKAAVDAGDKAAMLALRVEAEYQSRVFARSELRD